MLVLVVEMESVLERLQNDQVTQVGVAIALVAVVAGAAFLYFVNRKKSGLFIYLFICFALALFSVFCWRDDSSVFWFSFFEVVERCRA